MENPISTQLMLLEESVKIINLQISDIDTVGDRLELPDQIEDRKRKTLLQVKRRYLEFFSNVEQFLIEKLKTEPDKNLRFYVLHIRTLLEIYAHLLFLLNQNDDKQMAVVVANMLFTLSSAAKDSETQNEKLDVAYRNLHSDFKAFLERENIDIPTSIKDLSGRRLSKLELNYPQVDRMLNQDHIKDHALKTIKVFPTASTQIYKTYKYFSNYVHGNHLSNILYGKERFWIISKASIIASLVIELVNIKITENSRREQFENWLKLLDANAESFVLAWSIYKP